MQEITLEMLLEAGCHFGHKAERWHPKAAEFIWQEKDGIHIIDLAKTKAGLDAAMAFVHELGTLGKTVIFVGTKRQARGVVREAAIKAGASYLTQRWIGGFLTNWEAVHKNIQKINNMMADKASGAWKKFPKHEQVKLSHYLDRLNVDYEGVLMLNSLPDAVFVVDVRKESLAVRECLRAGIPVIGVVDTNANPEQIGYAIPANDDAVGSVQLIVGAIADRYKLGRDQAEKESKEVATKTLETQATPVTQATQVKEEKDKMVEKVEKKDVKKENPPDSANATPDKPVKKATKIKKVVAKES
jgi:small subunit ribosomal protein S2